MEEFKYLGTILPNQNSIQEEIKSRKKSGNVCYQACCCIWVLNLVAHIAEERTVKMFENRVLKGIFGPKGEKVTEERGKIHTEDLNELYSSISTVWVIK
jgi:hypothetical protein